MSHGDKVPVNHVNRPYTTVLHTRNPPRETFETSDTRTECWKNNELILRSHSLRARRKASCLTQIFNANYLKTVFFLLLCATDEMWLSKHQGFQWEYSWSLVAKIHRNGGCLCGIVHLGDEWKKRAEIDENGQSAELLTQWSFPLTSQSLCGVELFSIRLSMEGQWKDLRKQSV